MLTKAGKNWSRMERFEGRKKSARIIVSLISPAPTLAFKNSGASTRVSNALLQ